MDSHTLSTEQTSRASTHPFHLGSLYSHTHTDWMVMLIGLEHIGNGFYDVEFIRLHDQRTFYATYTALEWHEHWTHMTH